MKKIITALLISLITTSPFTLAKEQTGELLDKIIAVVNDQIILKSTLDGRIIEAKAELKSRGIPVQDSLSLKEKVLDNIILERIQLQRIKQIGLKIPDDVLLEKITEIAKNNRLSLLEIRNKLNQNKKNGFAIFRENIRQQLLFQKLRQVEVLSKTQVTEDEISNYLQRQRLIKNDTEYQLGHIIINLPESATPKQREASLNKAKEILQKLNNGEDFSQVAVRHSQGGNALKGGDLGWLKSDQIPTFFSEQINEMEPGQHSKLIRSSIGFHIIKLIDKRNGASKLVTQYRLYKFTFLSDDVKNSQSATAPKRLVEIAKNINSLESFQDLQNQFPDQPKELNSNTDLGWLNAQQIPEIYYQALSTIKVKQATRPILSKLGWEIIYLDETREKDLNVLNEREQALKTIQMKKANETFEIWLRRLKDEALIDNRLTANK